MAAMINRPMYEAFAARHLAVKGIGAMTTLEEGVMGTLPLDMSSDPAYWYIQGIKTFGATKSVGPGGAGNYSKVGLSLESTEENVICRILSWDATNDYVNLYRCARTDFSSDPGVYGYSLDTRTPEVQNSKAIVISNDDAAFPGQALQTWYQPNIPFIPWTVNPLILSPGQAFYMADNNANTSLTVSITWAEIPAYKAEL
jgi:hypothetical protein